jgi:hypothetical protein
VLVIFFLKRHASFLTTKKNRALYQAQSVQWRALSNSEPVQPSTAFSYISRALRQTTPYIVGALRLLAASFTPQEINHEAWSLYADFRPAVEKWGGRGEVRCDVILSLRKKGVQGDTQTAIGHPGVAGVLEDVIRTERFDKAEQQKITKEAGEPDYKKPHGLSLEEYEAALDGDTTFDDIDLDIGVQNVIYPEPLETDRRM